ncbi:hypothetical protein [Nocardioides mangrovicus]|uniref:hypothetical protein n=1 Tax=Nocardioides mangrovicus TaxID=2478913 RepID=UPI001314DF80|nr:hypothetical protein [Nocardioides mangrovicus]
MALEIDLQMPKRGWERQYWRELRFVVRADFGASAEQWLKSSSGWSAVLKP